MDIRRLLLAVGAAGAMVTLLAGCPRAIPSSAILVAALEATPAGAQWYRGNLHTHSTGSDGDASPAHVEAWYRAQGYQFLAITDHDVLSAPVATGNGPHWLVLRGEEVSDAVGNRSVHLGAINATTSVKAQGGTDVLATMQADVDAGRQAGALMQLNHPNYTWSITAEQLMRLRGTPLFELYNGHPLSHNTGDALHPPVERMWDIALAFRLAALHLPLLYGTASDDAHNYGPPSSDAGSPGRGWVVVLADRLTPDALATALGSGRFYASTGVRLERVLTYDRGLRVQVAAEPGVTHRIEFIGTRRGFDSRSTAPTSRTGEPIYGSRHYSEQIGRVLAAHDGDSADYVFDPDDLYVRARITASRPHPNPSQPFQFEQAWVQPVLGPAAARVAKDPAIAAPGVPPIALAARLALRFHRIQPALATALLHARTGDCSLDLLGDRAGVPAESFAQRDNVTVGGWIADRRRPAVPDSIGVLLRGGSDYLVEASNGVRRADVARVFGNPQFEAAGFNLMLPLDGVAHDNYNVMLVAWYGRDALVCGSGRRLTVHAL